MSEHRWYAVQTTAGHENKVRNLIQRKIDSKSGFAQAFRQKGGRFLFVLDYQNSHRGNV